MRDRVELAESLVERGADPNLTDARGTSPLKHAISYGRKEMVEILLQNGADPNAKDDEGATPLIHASKKTPSNRHPADKVRVRIVKLLIAANADVHLCDKLGKTPLGYARSYDNPEIAQVLITYGAIEQSS